MSAFPVGGGYKRAVLAIQRGGYKRVLCACLVGVYIEKGGCGYRLAGGGHGEGSGQLACGYVNGSTVDIFHLPAGKHISFARGSGKGNGVVFVGYCGFSRGAAVYAQRGAAHLRIVCANGYLGKHLCAEHKAEFIIIPFGKGYAGGVKLFIGGGKESTVVINLYPVQYIAVANGPAGLVVFSYAQGQAKLICVAAFKVARAQHVGG